MSEVMRAQHRKRLEQVRDEVTGLAGTAAKMASAINEVLSQGGTVNLQPQLNFITGAHARLLKDIGVVEHLQHMGVAQKPAPKMR